jgi:glycosyltransferase involved in cell wall biosynthesis
MSEAGDRVFTRFGRAPEARIPYPIAVRPATTGCDEEWHGKWSAEEPHRVMVLGRLIELKRPLAALATVRDLLGSGTRVHADFAGTGRLEADVSTAARDLPVTLHGHVVPSVVDLLLSRSHLLLHPASYDGWGMAVVEAASRGVPVVATAGCDAATELAARTCGVRITDGSPEAMARAARELIEAFQTDPITRSLDLIGAVEEVCGADRIVERSLHALASRGVESG